MTQRVVVTDFTFPNVEIERNATLEIGAEFEAHQCQNESEVIKALEGANVGVVQFAPVTRDAIMGMAKGASLIRYGIGFDNIDIEAANEIGVEVGYVPDYCVEEVADHTCALILSKLRKLFELDHSIRLGDWQAVAVAQPMKAFSASTIGFLGFGQIAQCVHARLKPFGFRFCASDPALTPETANEIGVSLCNAKDLFATSDAVTLHAPVNPNTHHMVNADLIKSMQSHAFVINTSRGALIDESHLALALSEKTIAGAALDVFEEEPLPSNSVLRQAPGVILTPHAAWYSEDAIEKLQLLVAADISASLKNQPLRRPVPGSIQRAR